MTKYTTEIIDDLRECEKLLKAFEDDKQDVTISTILTDGVQIGFNSSYRVKKNIPFTRSLISIIKTEAHRLKRELKQNLDIADVIHYEE